MIDVRGKRVLVVGLGKSGVAALEALLPLGALCAVQDTKSKDKLEPKLLELIEKNKMDCYLGTEPKPSEQFDMIVLSPGVP
ncbi:MAG: UDP-N-acetylmuramoyl-L-alanine--D-glutamate ligase, partial [Clostridiales bacterium]|nr:UDP-N-acetylmuramoyl-L-alanine--D-glutamate ligase [Clostridiales bacterium]